MKNIGLALSGGGVRAQVFHLGVLKWIAEVGDWDEIRRLSTVSGGSLTIASIIGANCGRWPSSHEYLNSVLPKVRDQVTGSSVQMSYILRCLFQPWLLFRGRAHVLARILRQKWGLSQTLAELPESPHWQINTTCYETGRNWRFDRLKVGDYIFGYTSCPNFLVSDAVAASAAVPGLIGPLVFWTNEYNWTPAPIRRDKNCDLYKTYPKIHLWDGGVYENLGLEPLMKSGVFQHGIRFLIVSDGSLALEVEPRKTTLQNFFLNKFQRLVYISMEQSRALRS